MRSLCYENQFSFILKLELINSTKNFPLRLALKERMRRTRKWPIEKDNFAHLESHKLFQENRRAHEMIFTFILFRSCDAT